ncbi:MAG: hypothetical protein ACR2FG_00790 [Marmoricola sp.]
MTTLLSTKPRKAVATVAIVAASLSVAACGSSSSSSDTKSSSASSSSAAPAPAAAPANAPNALAAIDSLTGVNTKIKLDSGFTGALTKLKLTPGVVGGAKLVNGSVVFPITGGNVTYFKPGTVSPYVIGQIQHEGSGLSLTAGPTKVELTNFNVDPGVSRVYGDVSVNGKVAVTSAYLFTLNGTTLKPLKTKGSNAILTGTKVFVSPVAAGLLNKTFKTQAVTKDLLIGVATIKVNTTPGD